MSNFLDKLGRMIDEGQNTFIGATVGYIVIVPLMLCLAPFWLTLGLIKRAWCGVWAD